MRTRLTGDEELRGRRIKRICLEQIDRSELVVEFEGGVSLRVWDNEQQCCEKRSISTDDLLSQHVDTEYMGITVTQPIQEDEDRDGKFNDFQFIELRTSDGVVSFSVHNVHNGFYAGFDIQAKAVFP